MGNIGKKKKKKSNKTQICSVYTKPELNQTMTKSHF